MLDRRESQVRGSCLQGRRDAFQALAERRPALVEDSVVVEGIPGGLADMMAGRSQPLEKFDQEFRAKLNITHDDRDPEFVSARRGCHDQRR